MSSEHSAPLLVTSISILPVPVQAQLFCKFPVYVLELFRLRKLKLLSLEKVARTPQSNIPGTEGAYRESRGGIFNRNFSDEGKWVKIEKRDI